MIAIRLMSKSQLKTLAPFGGLFLILSLNAAFLCNNAFRHFDFFNMGAFLDSGWRIMHGQKPFVDFMSNIGSVHMYVLAFFFMLWGFTKTAIAAHLVTISSIVIGITFLTAKKRTGGTETFLLTALSATSFYWACSHPWYTHTAFLWVILAMAALILKLPFTNGSAAFWTGVLCGAVSVLGFLTKTTVGAAAGGLFFIVLAFSARPIAGLCGLTCGTAWVALLSIPLFVHDPAECLYSLIGYSHTQSWRMNYFGKNPFVWLKDFYWVAALVIAVNAWVAKKFEKSTLLLFLGIWLLTLFIHYSSLSNNNADSPLMSLYLLIAFITIARHRTYLYIYLRAVLIGLTIFLTLFYAKNGFMLESWKPLPTDYELHTPAFKGWKCKKSNGQPLDQLVTYLNASVPQNDTILIVTDLPVLYGLTSRESLKKVPFGYAINYVPVPGKQLEETRQNIMNDAPKWVITHLENGGYGWNGWIKYLRLSFWITSHYSPAEYFGNYVLLKRNDI